MLKVMQRGIKSENPLLNFETLCRIRASKPIIEKEPIMKIANLYRGIIAVLFGVGIILVIFGIDGPLGELAVSFGHAFIIAAVLAAIVDPYLKSYFIREVTKNVYHHWIGYDLPEQIKENIKGLMGTTIIRTDHRIHYRFENYDTEKIKGQVRLEYKVLNFGLHDETYQPELAVETIDNPVFQSVSCHSERDTYEINSPDLVPWRPEENVLQVDGKKLKISPNRDPGNACCITFKWEITVPKNYTDSWSMAHPTMGATVIGEVPQGFKFYVSGITPQGDKWVITEMLMPGQSFRIRCFPV